MTFLSLDHLAVQILVVGRENLVKWYDLDAVRPWAYKSVEFVMQPFQQISRSSLHHTLQRTRKPIMKPLEWIWPRMTSLWLVWRPSARETWWDYLPRVWRPLGRSKLLEFINWWKRILNLVHNHHKSKVGDLTIRPELESVIYDSYPPSSNIKTEYLKKGCVGNMEQMVEDKLKDADWEIFNWIRHHQAIIRMVNRWGTAIKRWSSNDEREFVQTFTFQLIRVGSRWWCSHDETTDEEPTIR